MKKYLNSILIAVLCISYQLHAEAVSSLWENGRSEYVIVLPAASGNPGTGKYLHEAALGLQSAIQEASGVKLPVVAEDSAEITTPAIYIGNTAATRAAGIDPASFSGFSGLIAVRNGNVFICGNDRPGFRGDKVEHYTRYVLGSVKALTVFMEEFIGTRFLYPGEIGTETPGRNICQLPENLTRNVTPILDFGTGRHFALLYDYANNNFGKGTYFTFGGHTYPNAVPANRYSKTHPEYFRLEGGRRNPAAGHLCISNPDVQNLIYKTLLDRFDDGAEVVQLGQTDGYLPCECGSCRNFGGTANPAEQLWIFHRTLAERLKQDRPGKKLLIIAYAPTWTPPETFDTFPGNVMIELCRYDRENVEAWQKIRGLCGFTAYVYNWGDYPMPGMTARRTPEFCGEQAHFLAESGIRGIYRCGFGELFGMEGPGYYVYGKMLDEPSRNPSEIAEEFYEHAFGNTAPLMRGFYRKLNERLAAFCTLENIGGGYGSPNQLPGDPRALVTYIFSPDVLDTMERKLSGAEKAATEYKIKKRLELIRKEFNYVRNLAEILHCYNAYRINMTGENFAQLGGKIMERNTMLNSFFDADGNMKPFPEWPEIRFMGNSSRSLMLANGRLSAEIGAPLNWNIGLLQKKGVLPGAEMRKMEAVFTQETPPFDNFETGAWQHANWQELAGIQLGSIRENTRFKVLFDKENIYFAFEADMPDSRQIISMGRDSSAWLQDCVEIMLDPYGMREQSLHFVYNPVENSCYEGAIGMIKDPLHPLFGKEDISWNCRWEYRTARKNGKWYSVAILPFASLSVQKPANGTVWTMNVARQAYWDKKMKWSGELSLWSPNLENMSVNSNLNSFGELHFQY